MNISAEKILEQAKRLWNDIRTDRRELHKNPEVGVCLPHTKEYVKVAVQSEEKLDNVMKAGKITAAIHDDLYLMD